MPPKGRPIPESEHDNVIKIYTTSKMGSRKIGALYNSTQYHVDKILKSAGIKMKTVAETNRKHFCNEHFFDQIDTEEKAYFFGLLYADGCNKPYQSEITLALSETDKHILDSFSHVIETGRPVYLYKISEKDPTRQNVAKLVISNKHMCNILENHGMVRAKTLIKEFPQVILDSNEDIQRHFIRGYFDGNGSIGVTYGQRLTDKVVGIIMHITSTEDMCNNIQYLVYKYCNVHCNVRLPDTDHIYSYDVSLCRLKDCLTLCNWLYHDSTLYLERKHEKYMLLKESEEKYQ